MRCFGSVDTNKRVKEDVNDSSESTSAYEQKCKAFQKEIQELPEFKATLQLNNFLQAKINEQRQWQEQEQATSKGSMGTTIMTDLQVRQTLQAVLTTFGLHVEARIASLVGEGYYTIGPCGEECLAAAAHALEPQDSLALHYRHLAINLARHVAKDPTMTKAKWKTGSPEHQDEEEEQEITVEIAACLDQLILDRARGYTVSRHDPATGGVHCSIGSASPAMSSPFASSDDDEKGQPQHSDRNLLPPGSGDFLVTSTLASQCPPAVGRALGFALRQSILMSTTKNNNKHSDPDQKSYRQISMVTLGDGSVHNHHFWSAFHLARHARHRQVKCPVVFGISDNGLSISYKTGGYVDTVFRDGATAAVTGGDDPLMPVFSANGNDMLNVYQQTLAAVSYARKHAAPCVIVFKHLVRRFGHAATDRQTAYLELDDIQHRAESTILEKAIEQAVEDCGATTYQQVWQEWQYIQHQTRHAFARASSEAKVTRQDMLERITPISAPRSSSSGQASSLLRANQPNEPRVLSGAISTVNDRPDKKGKSEVMRKHMTRVIREVMQQDPSVVYLGEDVRHGGYYLVTEGLAQEFDHRILDFPPDETSLSGAALGFAQVGLTPVVEIPYAKYLDCGADMFYEIAIMHWLSNGQRPNGMVVRLQGFDRGLFGGSFHTSNMLPHLPPGVDAVCFSNGADYVRGFRNAIQQARRNGRVVVLVDCTNLLNLRHVHGKDRAWECVYPQLSSSGNDTTTTLGSSNDDDDQLKDGTCEEGLLLDFDQVRCYSSKKGGGGTHLIVTYGNGVVTALQARRALVESGVISTEDQVDILDTPYLTGVAQGLRDILLQNQYEGVLFADICKAGPGTNVLPSHAAALQQEGLLPDNWDLVCAPRTYNPLGNMCTFLNVDDIVHAFRKLYLPKA